MENLKNKLDEIIDTEMKKNAKVWDLSFVEDIQKNIHLFFHGIMCFICNIMGMII